MVLIKGVRKELKQKFSALTKRRIDQIIVETQAKYGIIDRDDAGYVLAFESGVKLKKYLEPEEIERLQALIKNGPRIIQTVKPKSTKNSGHKLHVIKIGKEFTIDHPILPKKIIDEASRMAEIYPIIYVFENSVRNIVQSVMEKTHGKTWWDKVSRKIRDRVADRMKDEEIHKWHGKRGAHQVFYTDIEDLSDIITTNWNDFQSHFPKQYWVKTMIEIIGKSRNVVAHNNPLSDDDIASVKVHFRQWTNQIKDFKI